MGEAKDAYERVLARVAELELDLGRTAAALQQSTDDNARLRALHDDLQYAQDKLRDRWEGVKMDLRTEREQRLELEREFQDQMHEWQCALEAKSKELDELHDLQPSRDIEMLRLKLVEEIAEPYETKLKAFNGKVQMEHRKAVDAKRLLDMEKLEREQESLENQRIVAEVKTTMKIQHDVLSKQLQSLEEDNRKLLEANAAVQVLRTQNHEYNSKCKFFQTEMDDLVASHRAEVEELGKSVVVGQDEIQKWKREKRQGDIDKERLKRELQEAQRQMASHSERTNALSSEIAALKIEVNDLRSTNNTLRLTAPQAGADDAEALLDARSQVGALEKDLAVKTREVQLLQDRLATASTPIAPQATPKEKSASSSMSATRLRDEADRLRVALAEKDSQVRQMKTDWEAELERCKVDHAKASAEVKQLQEKVKEANSNVQQAQALAGDHTREVAGLEAEREKLKAQLSKTEQRVREAEEAHNATSEKLVAAKHELDLCAVRAEQLVLQRESAQRALEDAERKGEAEKKHHGEQVKELNGKVHSGKKMNRDLKSKLKMVIEKLQEVQSEKANVLQVCDENRHKYELYMSEARNSLNATNSITDMPPAIASR